MKPIQFDVFGHPLTVVRRDHRWLLLSVSGSGINSPVPGVEIPSDIKEKELEPFLDDVFHEQASAENPTVIRITEPSR